MIKHATASTFVYDGDPGGTVGLTSVQVLLLWHPKFSRWMIPGGHVESHENCAEAATREVREETGLETTLLRRHDVDDGVHGMVHMPWVIVEQRIPARAGKCDHIHIDHLFVARKTDPAATPNGAEWVGLDDLDPTAMFPATRLLAIRFAKVLCGKLP
jgi:8-oxo-dGTP pyrophosphatase MutT (NUDIX family)